MGLKSAPSPTILIGGQEFDRATPVVERTSSLSLWLAWIRKPCAGCGHPRADHLSSHGTEDRLSPYPCTGGDGWFCGCGGIFDQ